MSYYDRPTLTPLDAWEPLFDALWLALGPQDRSTYAERCKVYHATVKGCSIAAARVAVDRAISTSQTRMLPAPGLLLSYAMEHESALRSARPAKPVVEHGAHECECGCGGKRWYQLLLDDAGKPRKFPADIAEKVAVPGAALRAPGFLEALSAQAGEPMLRQHLTCARDPKKPVDSAARLHFWGKHEDGTPVYAVKPRPGKAAPDAQPEAA